MMNFGQLVKKKEIHLNDMELCDSDLSVVIKVLQESQVLKELSLYNNKISLADDKFASALAQNDTLCSLDLGKNQIGREGAKWLATAFKLNATLQEVDLYSNHIGAEGAKCFADALISNTSLKLMYLGSNNIGDEGAHFLATSFIVNQSLRVVSVSENRISDRGAGYLTDALKCNHNIEVIDSGENQISDSVAQNIENILGDPIRKNPNKEHRTLLDQLAGFISTKNTEVGNARRRLVMKNEEIARKNEVLASREEQIAMISKICRRSLADGA